MDEGLQLFDQDPMWNAKNLSPVREDEISMFLGTEPISEEEGELSSSVEEEEAVSPHEYVRMLESVNDRLKIMYKSFPPMPNTNEIAQISFMVLYTAQYTILYQSLGGVQAKPCKDDSDEEMLEKATFIHLRSIEEQFFRICKTLSVDFYVLLETLITRQGGDDHPLLHALEMVENYTEMHSRRLKSDPTSQRHPKDFEHGYRPALNIVTGEEYVATPTEIVDVQESHVITEKKSYNRDDCCNWRWITFHPLPSDADYRNIDPLEGDEVHRLNVQVEEIQGTSECPEVTGFIVGTQWDKMLRLLHTMLHMEDYFCHYILGALKDSEQEQIVGMKWADAWELLVGQEYAKKPVEKFSREKKKVPMLVSRIAEFRDLMKEAIQIISGLTAL